MLGSLRYRINSSFYRRPVRVAGDRPVVSFCFDDFPRNAGRAGGAIVKEHGGVATFYASMGLMAQENPCGELFTMDDLERVLADGHEVQGHTFSHSSCRRMSPEAFERDVVKGQEAIHRITGRDVSHFAYPFGHVTLQAKKRLGTHLRSCRGTQGGINGPMADLNLLRAESVYGSLESMPGLTALLDENERRRGWLILYTHDVRPNPSRFGCTPELLERVVSDCVSRGFQLASVGAVVDQAEALTAATQA